MPRVQAACSRYPGYGVTSNAPTSSVGASLMPLIDPNFVPDAGDVLKPRAHDAFAAVVRDAEAVRDPGGVEAIR